MAASKAIIASDQLRAQIPDYLTGDDRVRWCEAVARLAALPLDPDAHAAWQRRMEKIKEETQ